MNAPKHITANILTSVPLKYFLGWNWTLISIFIIVGIAIDIDHLLFFMFKYHKINPKEWIVIGKKMRGKMQPGLYIFHSPEFNVILLLLSFFNQIVLAFFISNLIHISLDILEHYQYHKNFLLIKKWSIIYSLKT